MIIIFEFIVLWCIWLGSVGWCFDLVLIFVFGVCYCEGVFIDVLILFFCWEYIVGVGIGIV